MALRWGTHGAKGHLALIRPMDCLGSSPVRVDNALVAGNDAETTVAGWPAAAWARRRRVAALAAPGLDAATHSPSSHEPSSSPPATPMAKQNGQPPAIPPQHGASRGGSGRGSGAAGGTTAHHTKNTTRATAMMRRAVIMARLRGTSAVLGQPTRSDASVLQSQNLTPGRPIPSHEYWATARSRCSRTNPTSSGGSRISTSGP